MATNNEFWQWFNTEAVPKLRNRDNTFRKMFEYLDRFDRPVHIIETGCIEGVEDHHWIGNGCSTVLFGKYAEHHPGTIVRSVDIVEAKIEAARKIVPNVHLLCSDSIEALKVWSRLPVPKVDLLYLDASHLYWHHPVPSALHHLNELMAIMPALTPETLVVVDDSPALFDEIPRLEVAGKGEFVARYAFSVGADLQFCEYQIGFTNITKNLERCYTEDDLTDIIGRARAHVEAGRLPAADPLYRQILILTNPELLQRSGIAKVARGEACAYFAKHALEVRAFGRATDWYRLALKADPRAVEYRLDLARRAYFKMDCYDHAVLEALRATKIEPDNAEAWQLYGSLLHEKRMMDDAVEALDTALSLDPDNPDIIMDRAVIAIDMADYALVKRLCALAQGTARHGDAVHVMAMTAFRESRHEDAIALFDDALAHETTRQKPIVSWHKSHPLEAIGRWPEAWAARHARKDAHQRPEIATPMNRFAMPLWDGTGDRGKRIHVHAEAGAGDNLCLARYLPLIKARGYNVCYETRRDMVDLMAFSMPDIEVVPPAADFPGSIGLKSFDYHIPVGELQNVFQTSLNTVPWSGPYLKAEPNRIEWYADYLKGYKKKIGVCWSSGVRTEGSHWLMRYGQMKSMHFHDLLPIFERQRPGDIFVSLQVGPEREQMRPFAHLIRDLLPKKPDWSETAGLIENLDLVITVDTSIAHLAGAMGKPVWVMMQKDGASWHFLCERPNRSWNKTSPWYPSARIFRKRGDGWASVINDVKEALWKQKEARITTAADLLQAQ